ncbi:SpoIIE family protein phosphatase/ATP-binding protein [Kitasatospora kifunensis]|uniref:Serine phosphatase RsbU (Regulator of sigma subunit)/PAS domain-containing protein/anti-sigma regulatory factor (Ser/Thr protein kinase) n=1 Tax=Kitasatospora kifunensis TaxID=58351 RepID=A0A7W7VYE9_KITKI|nr:SpoIIE family protein phosphatase [Kitasatospora kifunensis]MBB4927466.1 serine phosphatase RsbU (regulator of sigma subunit)/PAS domain-containing protein/anti-sigma regulatory factor (Ser/Thr protein kinase) [Kitasatospora kifunensis]
MFALQVLVVLLLVVAAVLALVLQGERDDTREARNRSVAVAQTFANSPGIVVALESPNPTAILQPRALAAQHASGVDFIVVLNDDGIRYTHPNPARIGQKFVGTYEPALHGQVVIQQLTGTLGPLVQAVVPVDDTNGKVVGMVSAGITIHKVSGVVNHQLPLVFGAAAIALALATVGAALASRRLLHQTHGLGPAEMTRMYEHHDAVLHAVREGVLIIADDGRLLLANDEARRLLDLPPDAEGRPVTELGLDREAAEQLASGAIVNDEVLVAGDRLLVVNTRPTDRDGGPDGTVATLRDSTELHAVSGKAQAARKRLQLLYDATVAVGTTLDVTRTAEELADFAIPRFADYVTVDLAVPVLRGEEPAPGEDAPMQRAAVSGIRQDPPFYPVGEVITILPATPQALSLNSGHPVLDADLRSSTAWLAQDPERAGRVLEYGVHSVVRVPLRARGVLLGLAKFWRADPSERFDEDDLSIAEEVAARAALSIDNARRYTREHAMAVTLQRSLLPHGLPEQNALEVAFRYLPAQADVSGDWFDVIPLPGARVALVVGDVVGHGLHAAATMGRLRTAVLNFSTLDLPPDELLGHLDELVSRLDQDQTASPNGDAVTGASCLYAIYDPGSQLCTMARAGHPPPALVHPDGTVEFPDVPAGPPLGLGGLPFAAAQLRLPADSTLVLYTDGLVEDRERDIEEGLVLLGRSLRHAGRAPEEICEAVLAALLPPRPVDDIALLVARTRVLTSGQVAQWEVPADSAAVGEVRAAVSRQLTQWGLEEMAFVTELILSELVTNAIRYATEPISVRLLRDRTLICEVSDSSSTSPHLRYAASMDEGGRGLFLVSQFAERWGTRHTANGKVIWAEQILP